MPRSNELSTICSPLIQEFSLLNIHWQLDFGLGSIDRRLVGNDYLGGNAVSRINKHRARGATLGLIAVMTLAVIVIGIAFFFFAKMLGGARELQHVVDAGNLNVAKQSLRSPTVKLFGAGPYDLSGARLTEAQKNFSELRDPATGQIDLQVFDRLVGQATLVAMNASVDNYPAQPSDKGIKNAQTLIDLIANPTQGIGTLLANKLKAESTMDNNFVALAGISPMRMLNPGGPAASAISAKKNVSYMVRGLASNVELVHAVIPDDYKNFVDPKFLDNNTVDKNGVKYFKGYSLINVAVTTHPTIQNVTDPSTYPLMGVPLRPREKPHLVATTDFLQQRVSPLPAAGQVAESRVPPNAFESHGVTDELKTGKAIQALACAIAGGINSTTEYKVSIPCGYIVVANGNGVTPGNTAGAVTVDADAVGLTEHQFSASSQDIYTDILMNGGVYVTEGGAMSRQAPVLAKIQEFKNAHPNDPVPADLSNKIDGPEPKQAYADKIKANEPLVHCDNYNTSPSSPNAAPACKNNFNNMLNTYGYNSPNAGPSGVLNGLMAVETYKAQVINPRPTGGPAIISGLNNRCTGLKNFNLAGLTPQDPINFGKPATINNLIQQFAAYASTQAAATVISTQLKKKIQQIKPDASDLEISGLLNSSLSMGALKYIWMDGSKTLRCTDAKDLPEWINANQILPDGTTTAADTGYRPMNRKFVNLEGEQGYPSPWDCFGGPPDYGRDQAIWTRSSGFGCLQGILRFMNCVDADGTWDCPC